LVVIQYRDGIKVQVMMPWEFRSSSLIAANAHMRSCQDPSQSMAVEMVPARARLRDKINVNTIGVHSQ
jgi:hypothetical protein